MAKYLIGREPIETITVSDDPQIYTYIHPVSEFQIWECECIRNGKPDRIDLKSLSYVLPSFDAGDVLRKILGRTFIITTTVTIKNSCKNESYSIEFIKC